MPRPVNYKPLLFTTTLRNPERIKAFLKVLYQHNGELLTDDIIEKVAKELIKVGLFKPLRVASYTKTKWKSGVELSNSEADKAYNNNPQNHKELGFEKGWPSRFDTWYKFPKELGFVWYWPGQKITFSKSGEMLLDFDNPQSETLAFSNALAKYYRNNPFKNVLNEGNPLKLLLETIDFLNHDEAFNSTGISKQEISILICWRNGDSKALYLELKKLRTKYGYTPSNETILSICRAQLDDTKRNDNSLLTDYPDEFVRKMRLTSLISIRGNGRFIDWNHKEQEAIDYYLSGMQLQTSHDIVADYYAYISSLDEDFISKLSMANKRSTSTTSELSKWVKHYSWESISSELIKLSNGSSSEDGILKVIEQPLRLEFLTSLAISKRLPKITIEPNYTTDDEGLPVSFASGGKADIVCKEDGVDILIEVTLLKGVQQHIRESYSVQRHLEDSLLINANSISALISPEGCIDTIRHAAYIRHYKNLDVRVLNISDFVYGLDVEPTSLDSITRQHQLVDSEAIIVRDET